MAIDAYSIISNSDERPPWKACLLRKQCYYRGVMRARANILGDRFDFMPRCGTDALEVAKDPDVLT
jgi:uncharacterized protein (DUF934 family)